MTDNIWEELARSPLDPDPNEHPSILDRLVPTGLVIALGLAVGFVWGSMYTPTTPPTTLAAPTTSTSTTIPPPPAPILPAGYVEAGSGGMRAIAAYSVDDNLYIVVNQVIRSDLDRDETDAMYMAKWVLAGDGFEIVASRALESIASPGTRVVEFPGLSTIPSANPRILATNATAMEVRAGCNGCGATSQNTFSGEIQLEQLERPLAIIEPILIPVGDGITLSVDSLEIADEWGHGTWHLFDENDAIARVSLVVRFDGTDDPDSEGVNPTRLVPTHFFGVSQQSPSNSNPDSFAREGRLGLDRMGEPISAENQPTHVTLEWTVEWQHPVGDPITLPLTGLTDLGIID